MRFQINIDCTPEEARQFFGVPDVLPMQQAMMDQLSERLAENIQTMEPDALMKTWVPAIFQGWSQMQQNLQQNFWGQMAQRGEKSEDPDDGPKPKKKR